MRTFPFTLTQVQQAALLLMDRRDPEPVRSGYASWDTSGTTGHSFIARTLTGVAS